MSAFIRYNDGSPERQQCDTENRSGCSPAKKALAVLGLSVLVMAAGPALAELTQTDVMVAARTVSFIQKIGSGEMRVGASSTSAAARAATCRSSGAAFARSASIPGTRLS
jgi:hypothetical protein